MDNTKKQKILVENPETILELTNLGIGYKVGRKDITVLNSVNALLCKGELVSILAPNGAGKSTLIKTITGILPSLGGEIKILRRSLNSISAKDLAAKISIVLTDRVDADMLSVETLVSFGRYPYTGWTGRLNQEDFRAIEEAIEITGIQKLRNNFVSRLSDGEKQKVMIARAVAQQTPIMILDEPTAFLDLPNKVMIMRLLKKLAKDFSKTILISTHDLELALQTADKTWLISSDKKFYQGTPDELAANGSIHKTFPQVEFDKNSGKFIFSV